MHLIIARHCKAYKDSATGFDEDRTLTEWGRHQAEWLGQHLHAHGPRPRVIFASPVTRAAETAGIIHRQLNVKLSLDARLSTAASVKEALQLITELTESSLVIGHNPTLSAIAAALALPGHKQGGELRTGEAIVLQFKGGIGPGSGEVEALLRLNEGA